MCGLIGYVSNSARAPLNDSLSLLHHRGPDTACQWHHVTDGGQHIALGHARLSILDLSSAANQPFVSACGRYRIVFNGEIYNHAALRHRLEAEGVGFNTRSDTEVLLMAYVQWGIDFLSKLDGMFAFVIYDLSENRLFMARDHFGIKPLYYQLDKLSGGISFASEIRPLAAVAGRRLEPDSRLFSMFLMNGWLYEPQTGYLDIYKLGPGQCASFDVKSGAFQLHDYYDPLSQSVAGTLPELLHESTELQACADVPVGIFFSGGLDSSVVAAAYPGGLSGLFINYAGDPSDVGIDQFYARRIADKIGMPLQELHYAAALQEPDGIIADFRQVAIGTEEPISDYTYIATRQLSSMAVANGYKVMLSGMGGDELFAGYPRMRLARYANMIRALSPLSGLIEAIMQRRPGFAKRAARLGGFIGASDFIEAYTRLIGYFSAEEVARLLGTSEPLAWLDDLQPLLRPLQGLTPLKKAIYLDRYGFLSHNLTVTDRASMAESLEVRVPLMTPKLAAWAFHQSDDALVDMRHAKKPLRAFAMNRLGRELVDRPKQGFNPPLDDKIKRLGADRIKDELSRGPLRDLLDLGMAYQIVDRHFSGKANETYRLWQLLYFGYWLEAARA